MKNNKPRKDYIDIAKCIGIICVVCGHCGIARQFVYQFHMPLFVFLSGYLYNSIHNEKCSNVGKYFLSKIKTIYLPFVGYELFFLLIHNPLVKINIINELSNNSYLSLKETAVDAVKILTMGHGETMAGALWYLIALFEVVLIATILLFIGNILDKKIKKGLGIVFVALVTIGLYVISFRFSLPRNLNKALILLVFYMIGVVFKKVESHIKYGRYIFIPLIIVPIIIAVNNWNESWNSNKTIALAFISALTGILSVYQLSVLLGEYLPKLFKKAICYIGKNSMGILVFHLLMFGFVKLIYVYANGMDPKLIGKFPTLDGGIGLQIAYLVVGVGGSLIIYALIQKLKKLIATSYKNKKNKDE